jgi:hypothetical protein
LFGFVLILGAAAGASAQGSASIAGVVRDASGAVLPGVTVEASSPALIEKTRSAVTDGAGQYKDRAAARRRLLPSPSRSPACLVQRDGASS